MSAVEGIEFALATESDVAGMLAIYGPIIQHTSISFEADVPSHVEFGQRVANIMKQHPWLVCRIDDAVVGYAYAGLHRERAAYSWSCEVSVYVHESFHKRKVGSALYQTLFEVLKLQGYFTAFAGATLPNDPSVGFHLSMGFTEVGVYHKTGFKDGHWHDVIWFEKRLQEGDPKHRPEPITAVAESLAFQNLLKNAVQLLA